MTVFKPGKGILFFLILISGAAFGQNYSAQPPDAYRSDSLFAVRNAVKIDPIQIVFGDYRLSYERIINGGFSIEVSGGITRRNYASGWFDYSLDNLGKNVDIKTGYAFSVAFRKYLYKSDELYGPYLSLGIDVKNYKTDYTVIDSAGALTDAVFEDRRMATSYFFNIGYQALPAKSNVFTDFYIGVSLRHKDYAIVQSDNIYDASAYSISKEDTYGLGVQVGVKVGFGF